MMEENSARAALERAREALERALDEARRAVAILNKNRRNPGCAKALNLAGLAEHDVSLARAELAVYLTSPPATQGRARSGVETARNLTDYDVAQILAQALQGARPHVPRPQTVGGEFDRDDLDDALEAFRALPPPEERLAPARALLAEENK